ncbi:MAG: response regulator transcription factor [Solirubrobacterales bacterium]|nr:response regulator transcription factor [Solirubrobacterales bacterium]
MARVFLCDDSDSFRLLARLNLEALGHEVVGECGRPPECAALLRAAAPDLALVDGFLPESIPLASLREGLPDTRFVLYSGMPIAELAREAQRTGADAAIGKSASFGEVAELISSLTAS